MVGPERLAHGRFVCGVRVEDAEDPLIQKIRVLDKVVDERAKGKAMANTLRGRAPAGCTSTYATSVG